MGGLPHQTAAVPVPVRIPIVTALLLLLVAPLLGSRAEADCWRGERSTLLVHPQVASAMTEGTVPGLSLLGRDDDPGSISNFEPDRFGLALVEVGDIDDDGIADLVAAKNQNGAGTDGSVVVLFMKPGGRTVRAVQETNGLGLGLALPDATSGLGFGAALAAVGDLDGDGIQEVAAGTSNYEHVVILFFNSTGHVRQASIIGEADVGLVDTSTTYFGRQLVLLRSADSGAIRAWLAVGAPYANGGRGAIVLMGLDTAGELLGSSVVGDYDEERFPFLLQTDSSLGDSMALTGDVDGNGAPDFVAFLGRRAALFFLRETTGLTTADLVLDRFQLLDGVDLFNRRLLSAGSLNGDNRRDFLAVPSGEHNTVAYHLGANGTVLSRRELVYVPPTTGPPGNRLRVLSMVLLGDWEEEDTMTGYVTQTDFNDARGAILPVIVSCIASGASCPPGSYATDAYSCELCQPCGAPGTGAMLAPCTATSDRVCGGLLDAPAAGAGAEPYVGISADGAALLVSGGGLEVVVDGVSVRGLQAEVAELRRLVEALHSSE